MAGERSGVRRRILITGAAGFAGSHLLDLLDDGGSDIVAWRRPGERLPAGRSEADLPWVSLDVCDRKSVADAAAQARPDIVYHLAGAAHVGAAWTKTAEALAINALGTHHLVEGFRRAGLAPRIFIPSSAYVYQPSNNAIDESAAVRPDGPYGLSKVAQEMVGQAAFEETGIPILLARAFNHVGPRQDPSFSTSSFARQIAMIEAGQCGPVMRVGNLSARRDLTDVRDTVRAYRRIAEAGTPARVYNVCSGVAHPVSDILDSLLRRSRVPIQVQVDPLRLRPNDTRVVLGNPARLRTELGWMPEIDLERTLADLLDYWRTVVGLAQG